jgi:glucose-1-phosphate thymidylyltransferase
MKKLQAIIPAAGIGTRLKPHTHTAPKALIRVAGKPILAHILDEVVELGITEVTLVTGFFAEKVEEYATANYPRLNLHFTRQTEQLGLGHAVWTALEFNHDLPALIVLGDTIVEADLAGMLKLEENVIAVAHTEDPQRFGIVSLDGDFISGMVEKPKDPPSNLAIVGVYLIRDADALYEALGGNITEGVKTKGEFQLTDALAALLDAGHRFRPWKIAGWFDCGKPETLLETNRVLLDRRKAKKPELPDCVIIPPVHLGEGVKLTRSVIGPHVSIARGAVITDSIIADSIIGSEAILTNVRLHESLIGDNARVAGRLDSLNLGDDSDLKFS